MQRNSIWGVAEEVGQYMSGKGGGGREVQYPTKLALMVPGALLGYTDVSPKTRAVPPPPPGFVLYPYRLIQSIRCFLCGGG